MKTCKKCMKNFDGPKCKPCWSKYVREWNTKNPDRVKAISSRKYEKNREKILDANKSWRKKNPEKVAGYWKKFHETNAHLVAGWNRKKRIKNQDKNRETAHKYHAARPGLKSAWDAKRRAQELNATPAWTSTARVREFYETAHGLSMLLGEWHHVDHIVPLQSKSVCGLHCEANMQVLTATENHCKGNARWPYMP